MSEEVSARNKPIVFLCHPYHRGGVTRWMADMAIECAEHKLEVYFVTVAPKKPFYSGGGRETLVSLLEHQKHIRLITAQVGWSFEFGTEAFKSTVYAGLLSNNVPQGANVILADDPAVWAVASQLHGNYNFIGVLHADEEHYYSLAARYKDVLALFICVSERIRKNLFDRNTFDTRKVFTIPCGIPLPPFAHGYTGNNIPAIIYVGRVTQYQKRVFDIPKICTVLKKQDVPFRLSVIGSGDDLEELKAQVQKLDLDKQVTFLGWLQKDQILGEMQKADILLLTSDFEGMPVAVMEALSCGCGVVSTCVSGVEDYVDDPFATGCLWLYPVGDTERAAEQISHSLNIGKEQRRLQARKLAEKEFSITHCLQKYMSSFDCIDQSQPQRKAGAISYGYSLRSYLLSFTRYIRLRFIQ